MSHEIDLSKYQIRTDLAIESISENVEGVRSVVSKEDSITITDVYVDEIGSARINKQPGNYITIEFEDITDYDNGKSVENIFALHLKKMLNRLNISKNAKGLIVGLGNPKSTPDSLGPLSINNILVTRHLFELHQVEDGFMNVAAITPGVMGTTGLETGDIISAVIEKFKPDFVLAIDALASQSLSRVNKTIQMTDAGIHPGSGIGNSRKELSLDTLKIPVIAIGVPTVVDAITIVGDTINYMFKHYSYSKDNIDNPINKLMTLPNYLKKEVQVNKKDKETLLGIVGTLDDSEIRALLYEVLTPIGFNLMVTPKEVDFLMDKLGIIIGSGINKALHEKVN